MKIEAGERFSENLVRHVVLGVLDELEKKRDLSSVSVNPWNVVVVENFDVRVIDLFRKDDEMEKEEKISYHGAVKMFLPPEVHNRLDNKKSQVFSLAYLAHMMLKAPELFGPTPSEILAIPFISHFSFPTTTDPVFSILNSMMSPDPDDRPTFHHIKQALKQPRPTDLLPITAP